jgi:hypothetical protein
MPSIVVKYTLSLTATGLPQNAGISHPSVRERSSAATSCPLELSVVVLTAVPALHHLPMGSVQHVLSHPQYSGINTAARFDLTTGAQVNALFGQVTSTRAPRIMQGSLRFTF